MRDPLVSVFMPVHNALLYIRESVESILNQTFKDLELIIVDDASTDGTVSLIERIKDPRIRLYRQVKKGCYPARNLGLRLARGKYLANMDADDISRPDRIEKQIRVLEDHPEAIMVGTMALECDMDDSVRLPHVGPMVPATIMFRREMLTQVGFYDERLMCCADREYVWRASLLGAVQCIDEPLYVIRIHPSSMSGLGASTQSRVNAILERRIATADPISDFTLGEKEELESLFTAYRGIAKASRGEAMACYHNRLATAYRLNKRPDEALRHVMRAVLSNPSVVLSNRRLWANALKSLGLKLGWQS